MRESQRVAIFGPHPLLTVAIETRGASEDDIHLHAGGQGVWVARMCGELGAYPVLCGFDGGETGAVLAGLLDRLPGERRLVHSAGATGCYVVDRRPDQRQLIASAFSSPPSRHEVDDLLATAVTAALESEVLVVCNPFPGDSLPLDLYADLVGDVRAGGVPVLVDLSTPRLDRALEGRPNLVKINDWELAEYVCGPVSEAVQMRKAVELLRERGAESVIITRGAEPGLVFHGEQVWELVPPRFERGSREGCGDTMMGAIAAGWAAGLPFEENVRRGAAAGAANFLRHGLGSGSSHTVEELVARVELRPL
jgi:1-phosphofructokinase